MAMNKRQQKCEKSKSYLNRSSTPNSNRLIKQRILSVANAMETTLFAGLFVFVLHAANPTEVNFQW